MMYCAVKLNELNEALDAFNRALELAKLQSDRAAESAVRRAIDDINNTIAKQTRENDRLQSGFITLNVPCTVDLSVSPILFIS
jgi:hypothetical protein